MQHLVKHYSPEVENALQQLDVLYKSRCETIVEEVEKEWSKVSNDWKHYHFTNKKKYDEILDSINNERERLYSISVPVSYEIVDID